jgi:hypothetical protein
MSNPHLPAEILDHVVDQLHDAHDVLRNCCLVSKSWIPRTRKHLFAEVAFLVPRNLRSWRETFPDPSTSPAHYTKTLSFSYAKVAKPADMERGGWIRVFSRIERLEVDTHARGFDLSNKWTTPLALFHGLSPAIRSLRVAVPALPFSQIFDLIFSFPLLEDLAVNTYDETSADNGDGSGGDEILTAAQPLTPPTFTGSLNLTLWGELKPFTRRLLSLVGGIHFRKLTVRWYRGEDPLSTMALVEGCSHTLKSLNILYDILGKIIRHLRRHKITQYCLQTGRGPFRSTSRKRQNSQMCRFTPIRGTPNGSSRHSKPLHQNIAIFDKSRFVSHTS